MKKRMFLMSVFIGLTFLLIAQDTVHIDIQHVKGESVWDFLKSNWWGIGAIILLCISEWMGESPNISEGSIYKKIVNWLTSFFVKKATYTSPKVKRAMKHGIVRKASGVIILLLSLSFTTFSQSILKPIPKNYFEQKKDYFYKSEIPVQKTTDLIWRMDGTIIIDEVVYDKELNKWVSNPISGVGPVIGLSKITASPDGPVEVYSIKAGALLGMDIIQTQKVYAKFITQIVVLKHFMGGITYSIGQPEKYKPLGFVVGGNITF